MKINIHDGRQDRAAITAASSSQKEGLPAELRAKQHSLMTVRKNGNQLEKFARGY
jgi:hypothetical protein